MDKATYQQQFTTEDSPGWLAIDDQLDQIYGDTEPRHYPPLCGLHYAAGGSDPIDGASIYDSNHQEFHRHIVSYGLSELYYDEEKAGGEFSKWGFELTFRLLPFQDDQHDPIWAIQVMNNLARYVFTSGKWFEENHFVPANGPIRLDTETEITGFVFALDPELGKIQTPHGEVSFLQMVGITNTEVEKLKQNPTTDAVKELIDHLKKDNPLLITDLNRK
ncbi:MULTISPECIES: suppressor of fused domain protein [unclassified Pedobacter]|uniref:suppressor of fused domain protein n=1 Tax=unclassified Pedobacter TaxID=2628915 RepID=UPI000B4C0584|nr:MULTISPECIES: suppressor of fused domain protein [unclassified Pedobacter]MCX2431121.1 suppressor of fused domain protein [Pedobacter sp. GR22-10]OWK69072.1 riboflavin biosynthesis protein [Pedobacter sp. AJM]